MKVGVLALLVVGAAGIAGCDVAVRPPSAAVEVDAGGPVVYDSFYEGGYYDGPYWVWHDREGHFFRERREFHERRVTEHARVGEHHEVEHHEEHRDDHRY
jgi:hypothetical protein